MKKDKLIYIPVGILTSVTALSGVVLSGAGTYAAAPTVSCTTSDGVETCTTTTPVTATVSVADACTLSVPNDPSTNQPYAYSVSVDISNGSTWVSTTEAGNSGYKDPTLYAMTASCNDANGFSITAVGYGPTTAGGAATAGSTVLMGTTAGIGSIATGTATSGTTSTWAFKVSSYTGTNVGANSGIQGSYGSYSAVPGGSGAEIIRATGAASGTTKATFTTDYQVYVSANQPAGSYTGGVKYSLVHGS